MDQTKTLAGMNGILLYLDEIQYLNKKQAAVPAGISGKWQHHPHRLHHRKPLFLRLRSHPEPVYRL